MKRLTLFTAVVFIVFSYSTALADLVQITIESYANPTLGVKSTIVETADPYDPNDTDDQLEIAYQVLLFALSSDGWDLTAKGFYTPTVQGCGGGQWHTGVSGNTFLEDPDYYQTLLGYEVNDEALIIIYQHPQNQAMGLAFNTDVWCPLQGAHDFCESENNYGVISGLMAGGHMQCAVTNWGTFTVEVLPPPAVSGCIKIYGEGREGLEVHLNQKPNLKDITVTDSDGCFEFQDLLDPTGKFDLKVKCPEVEAP